MIEYFKNKNTKSWANELRKIRKTVMDTSCYYLFNVCIAYCLLSGNSLESVVQIAS